MKASDLLVKSLENEGVEYIFGLPGEENLDFLNSLRDSKQIRFIMVRHEQAAGFMAATVGRLTGKVGVCLTTLGPGATNLVTAAAYAQLGGMPMLMITGEKPIKKRLQGHFQIVDTVEIMNPVTKLNKQIVNADSIPALVREAFRIAEEERPGATHLQLPEDIAQEETHAEPFLVTQPRRPIAEEKAINSAVSMIEKAKRPLILVGAAANRKRTSKMLIEFIDKIGIYFFNTQMGKGVVDERHPCFLGTAALSQNDYIHCAIDRADLIINIGHDVVEKPPFIMKKDGAYVTHINFFSAQVDGIYFPQHEVIGDIANTIWQIKEKIRPQPTWDFSYFKKIKQHIDRHTMDKTTNMRYPLVPQRIVKDVRDIMPDNGILSLDNGMYKIWFARNYKTYLPNTLLLDNALATMGAGLTSAIAAKLLFPEKKILAVLGDGGFMMNSQELETAIRLKLDFVIVILKDNGFGMIQWKQNTMKFEKFGLEYDNPDFVRYGRSYGAQGYRVSKAEDFKKLLKLTLHEKGIHIIEVPIDYSENEKVFTYELMEKTCNL